MFAVNSSTPLTSGMLCNKKCAIQKMCVCVCVVCRRVGVYTYIHTIINGSFEMVWRVKSL